MTRHEATFGCPICSEDVTGYDLPERYDDERINLGRRVGPARLQPCRHVAWAFAADEAKELVVDQPRNA